MNTRHSSVTVYFMNFSILKIMNFLSQGWKSETEYVKLCIVLLIYKYMRSKNLKEKLYLKIIT